MRLFFAIPLTTATCKQLTAIYPAMHHPAIRLVPETNLHITVCFLGETNPEALDFVRTNAKQIAATQQAFTLSAPAITLVSKKHKPVMIWAQLQSSAAFDRLCAAFAHTFHTAAQSSYVPHITLARIKQLKQLPFTLPKTEHFSIPVSTICLFASRTLPAGPEYTVIDRWQLDNEGM